MYLLLHEHLPAGLQQEIIQDRQARQIQNLLLSEVVVTSIFSGCMECIAWPQEDDKATVRVMYHILNSLPY